MGWKKSVVPFRFRLGEFMLRRIRRQAIIFDWYFPHTGQELTRQAPQAELSQAGVGMA